MHFLDPDILDLTRQLSPPVNAVAALVGALLWLFGAYSHRFWLAMVVTVTAGVVGLYLGRDFGVQPLVAALLLALAAGVLSLALARITLFLAGGLAALLLARAFGLGWNEFVCFVAGGLAGVCFYRLWIMGVSSLVGTVLASYAILGLLDSLARVDSVAWVGRCGPLLNWGLAAAIVAGVIFQFVLDRRLRGKGEDGKGGRRGKKKRDDSPTQHPWMPPQPPQPTRTRWWWPGRAA